jgi:Clp protease
MPRQPGALVLHPAQGSDDWDRVGCQLRCVDLRGRSTESALLLAEHRFLLHQPAGGAGGSASDIEIEAREILQMRDRVNRILARETGQPLERIEEDPPELLVSADADGVLRAGGTHYRSRERARRVGEALIQARSTANIPMGNPW